MIRTTESLSSQSPLQENSRLQLLNDIWMLTILAVLLGTGLPWLASDFQVDFVQVGWGLLALGALPLALTFLGSPLRQAAWRIHAVTAFEIAGIVLLGFVWDHVGALQNPLFLMTFVLPIVGAVFLSRWHPYLLAAVGILTVGFVSLAEAPELRWFASGLVGGSAWLDWMFGRNSAAPDNSFAAFSAPLNYLIVLLEVFSIGLVACAVTAEYIGIIFGRLAEQTAIARNEAQRGEELWSNLIEKLPLPALLVDPASMSIVAASASAVAYLQPENEILEGRRLFEVLSLSYPEAVQELIGGADGQSPSTVIRIADEMRLARARVLHVIHKERRLALLTIEDGTDMFSAAAALDSSEYAAVVVDQKGRVLMFNKSVVGLLRGARIGMDAAALLPQADTGLRWWEPGIAGRRKMHMQIDFRVYQLTACAVRLPGEDASIFAVSFLPVADGVQGDLDATSSTLVTGTMRKLS